MIFDNALTCNFEHLKLQIQIEYTAENHPEFQILTVKLYSTEVKIAYKFEIGANRNEWIGMKVKKSETCH